MKNYPEKLEHGAGVLLTLDPTRLLLAFDTPQSRDNIESMLRGLDLTLEDSEDEQESRLPLQQPVVNHTDRRFWIRSRQGREIDDALVLAIEDVFKSPPARLDWLGPVYRLPAVEGREGLLSPLPNVMLLKAAPSPARVEGESLSVRLRSLGLEEVEAKSKYLGPYAYYRLPDWRKHTVYELRKTVLKSLWGFVQEIRFENMPMTVPVSLVPTDNLFAQQWNMTRIHAPEGWDISTGASTVLICVLDSGCELNHPDLQARFATTRGLNLGTMLPEGSPRGLPRVASHGTCCAGVIAATIGNTDGTAGLAGNCQLMPLALENWTDVEVAAGINYAANNGARVISISFGQYGPGEAGTAAWDFAIIDPAIVNAVNVHGCVLCAAAGNEDNGTFNRYPARHPLVMACGASDQTDNRKSRTSPDGDGSWGSNFAPGISVVAPGLSIPTTDRLGADGYNPMAGAAGDYFMSFLGTSAATPHVAGLAGLLLSQYPTLTASQVRGIIERTADRVGTVPYAEEPAFANGPRNQEMGYGRINVFHALDLADVMIKDWPADDGTEPSTPPGGDFWDFSDVVVRGTDDNVFLPGDPAQSSNVVRGQTNYLYVRVTNNGPQAARNVSVSVRITPFVGLQFVYPDDWTRVDASHVSPTPVTASFASIPSGGSAMARFTLSAAQVEELWGWSTGSNWHPCLLARVEADNDYAFATSSLTGSALSQRRNNFAQRNLSVVDVLAGASVSFPFVLGHRRNAERLLELLVERSQLPKDMELLLSLDEDGRTFPLLDLTQDLFTPVEEGRARTVFLARSQVETWFGGSRGILTLEKGSHFDPMAPRVAGKVNVVGGELILREDQRFVAVKEAVTKIRLERQPNALMPLALRVKIPAGARKGEQFSLKVSQLNQQGERIGGATVLYIVR